MDQRSIQHELDTFITRTSQKLPVEKIILFGSFAKKIARKDSDIDLLVVGNFKKHGIDDPTDDLYDLYFDLQTRHPMHVVGINDEDFEKKQDSITLESIRNTGTVIYQSK